MIFEKVKKKKLSIDFTVDNYDNMQKFARKHGMSNSDLINYLISHFILLSDDIKKAFVMVTVKKLEELKVSYADLQEYEKKETDKQIGILQDLVLFFTDGVGYVPEPEEKMAKTEIRNGYVIYPDEWIVVDSGNAQNCEYVGVIEVKNGKEYKAPHFIFFSEVPINELSAGMEEEIYNRCEAHYPAFRKIRAMQIDPIYDENNNLLNGELWQKAPTIGIFQISIYGKDTSFPAGAMVVKN